MNGDPLLTRSVYWLLYAGLAAGIGANVAIIAFEIEVGTAYMAPANVTAILVSVGAIFLLRWRRRNPR